MQEEWARMTDGWGCPSLYKTLLARKYKKDRAISGLLDPGAFALIFRGSLDVFSISITIMLY